MQIGKKAWNNALEQGYAQAASKWLLNCDLSIQAAKLFRQRTNKHRMDIEKNLASTYDPDFILKDHLLYQNQPVEIYAYEDYIGFVTEL